MPKVLDFPYQLECDPDVQVLELSEDPLELEPLELEHVVPEPDPDPSEPLELDPLDPLPEQLVLLLDPEQVESLSLSSSSQPRPRFLQRESR
jgi:hypothetical protein